TGQVLMSRFHQLSDGNSGSGTGNGPPRTASMGKAVVPDKKIISAARQPHRWVGKKLFIIWTSSFATLHTVDAKGHLALRHLAPKQYALNNSSAKRSTHFSEAGLCEGLHPGI